MNLTSTGRLTLLAGLGLAFAACSAEQNPTAPDFAPSFNVDGSLPSEVTLCKIGPEDSWADFEVSADGGTLVAGSNLRIDAALSLDDLPEGCVTIWKTAEGDPEVVTLSVTEVDMTPGTYIEKIIVQGGLDGGFELDGTHNSVSVRVDAVTDAVIYFKNAGTPEQGGGDGCTPGFWRQDQHFQYWTAYAPGDSYATVFGVDRAGTLLENVWAQGGGADALARHSVAALLNASSAEVDYDLSVAEIIAGVQTAFDSGDFESFKDMLEGFNEQGCSVDKSNS